MEFKKHQMMSVVRKMMSNPFLSTELLEELKRPRQLFDSFEEIIALHMVNVRKLGQQKMDDDVGLRGMKEMAYLGFITKRIKRLNKLVEDMGYSEMNVLLNECVEDWIEEEIKRVGPTIEDVKRKQKEIEDDLGLTHEQMKKGFK